MGEPFSKGSVLGSAGQRAGTQAALAGDSATRRRNRRSTSYILSPMIYKRALLALFIMLSASLVSWSQIKQGKTRPLTTKVWMKTVNGPQCSALAKMLKTGPADDKEWETAAAQAQMLSESGYVMMADGRCPDAVWAEACKTLQEAGSACAKAAAEKNLTEAQAQMQKILSTCKGCHAAHKK